MATEKFSAYTSRGTQLSTELNSLASGSYSAASAAFDNSANLDRYAVFELTVTFGSAPTDLSTCTLFLVQTADATNYEDGGGATRPQPQNYLASVVLRNVTTAQRLISPRFEIPPTLMKFILLNSSGQAFPASGSVVKLYTFNRTVG